jgi:hypothetical protein
MKIKRSLFMASTLFAILGTAHTDAQDTVTTTTYERFRGTVISRDLDNGRVVIQCNKTIVTVVCNESTQFLYGHHFINLYDDAFGPGAAVLVQDAVGFTGPRRALRLVCLKPPAKAK